MDNINAEHLNVLKNKIKQQNENKYLEDSKKRLENIITTKIRTTFIGAIDIFEQNFGELWGYNSNQPLTSSQKELLKLWNQIRTEILDLGNNQLRAAQLELSNHTIKWNRYTVNIPIKPQGEKDEK